jgi:mercuric ion transport protein
MTARGRLYASFAGTVAVALCCFTPILVFALAAVGLAAFTPYLDFVLFPALGIMIVVTWISYRRYVRATIGER